MAKKNYPLEIENVGDDTYILMSRGHHDVHEFMRKVRAEGYTWPLGMPEHLWLRAVPTRLHGYSCIYSNAKQGERGAFPVTQSTEAYGVYRYEVVAAQKGGV